MDARELLGYLFAAASLVLVFVGIWALSYYSPARSYERELRKERRARRARNRHQEGETLQG
jgi:hypothetical protein